MMSKKNIDKEETGLEDFFQPDMHIEDHDYDEIKELDNPSPGWIMAIFYLTIGIAILYGAYYFWLKVGDQQEAEYTKSVQAAQEKYKSTAPSGPMAQLSDASSIEEGKQIYMAMNCQACHGTAGEGNAVGPNLTDNHYLHGCKFDDIFNTIKNGFPAKGMTAFKAQLSDQKIQQVASYVMSLKGSNPPGAKEPQGEICK